MATTEKKKPAMGIESHAPHQPACHKNLWEYFGWVERLLPANALGLQKALYVLRHPGATRHERARATVDAIAAIIAVRALLDTKPTTDPAAATLRDFDPTACACIRQLAQELIEYAVPAMLAPGEQEAADLRLALLLAADMPPLPGDSPGSDVPDMPPALDALQPAGQSCTIAPQKNPTAPHGGTRFWLAALANDLLDEHGEERFSEGDEEDEEDKEDKKEEDPALLIRAEGKKETR